MTGRTLLGSWIVGTALAVALPSPALAAGRDGGATHEDRSRRDEHRTRRDEAETAPASSPDPALPETPLERRRREQKKVALYIVGGALGIYILFKIVRR